MDETQESQFNRIRARREVIMDRSRAWVVKRLENHYGPQNLHGCHKSTLARRLLIAEFGSKAVEAWEKWAEAKVVNG